MPYSMNYIKKHSNGYSPIEVEIVGDASRRRIIREVLTRIGNVETGTGINEHGEPVDTIVQVGHLLYVGGKYYVAHYKHMYMSTGKTKWSIMNHENYLHVRYIAKMLQEWGLVTVKNDVINSVHMSNPLKVAKFEDIGEIYDTKANFTERLYTQKKGEAA